jgi:hypothetical protein
MREREAGAGQLGDDPGRDEDDQDLAQGQPAQQRAGLRVPQAGQQPAQDQGRHRARRSRPAGRHGERELFFGEQGTTNGAHNDITRVTKLLHHAVAEMGMYRKTRLNYGALDHHGAGRNSDDETRMLMEQQSERLYGETRAMLGAAQAADRAPGRQADGGRAR